jgi:hypothetical protein
MSDAETRYAQIKKEMLAISFAFEHFHQYVFGQAVEVGTDQKPLMSIFKKSLNDCPLRLQRLLLRVQKYDLRIGYTPGIFFCIPLMCYVSQTDKISSGGRSQSVCRFFH